MDGPGPVSLPQSHEARFRRFALLMRMEQGEPIRVEIQHPTIKGARIVGYLIDPDENYSVPDGIGMLEAMERRYRMAWNVVRAMVLKRI